MATKKAEEKGQSKKRAGSKEQPLAAGTVEKLKITTETAEDPELEYVITEANLKDHTCLYKYAILKGVNAGDKHQVTNTSDKLVEESLLEAFSKFNVHLACIDDVFKHSGIEIEDVNKFHTHDLTGRYTVTGFKIKGGEELESIVLSGNKVISSASGRIELDTPKIMLDNLSSYPWYKELIEAAEDAMEEVRQYKEGNFTLKEKPEEPEADTKTGNLFEQGNQNPGAEDNDNIQDAEFEEGNGKPDPKKLMKDFDKNEV